MNQKLEKLGYWLEDKAPRLNGILWQTRHQIERMLAAFVPSFRQIDGIDQSQQAKTAGELIGLKIKRALKKPMSFQEEKILSLSEASRSTANGTGLFEIKKSGMDPAVTELARSINNIPFAYTQGSCSGHFGSKFVPEGFIFIRVEEEKRHEFQQQIQECIEQFNSANPEIAVTAEYRKDIDSVDIRWKWRHPELARQEELERARSEAYLKQDMDEYETADASLFNFKKSLDNEGLNRQAIEFGIPQKFVQSMKTLENKFRSMI